MVIPPFPDLTKQIRSGKPLKSNLLNMPRPSMSAEDLRLVDDYLAQDPERKRRLTYAPPCVLVWWDLLHAAERAAGIYRRPIVRVTGYLTPNEMAEHNRHEAHHGATA